MDELQKEFIVEASDWIKELDTALVEFSHDPIPGKQLNKIFRVFHTIKGACGFLNLEKLETLTHEVETVLAALQSGATNVTTELISSLFECVDLMKYILKTLEQSGEEPDDIDFTLLDSFLPNQERRLATDLMENEGLKDYSEQQLSSNHQSIRVNLSLLESLTTAVTELVLVRNQLLEIGAESNDHKIEAPLKRLNQITSYLQETSLKAHLQPIGSAWSRLPRLLHDLSQSLEKDIILKTEGSEVELDRQIIEVLQAPLIHLIRNAADHGIETARERQALGKPEQGTIFLHAEHKDGAFHLIIKDDGRGIDAAKIRHQLLKNKLSTPSKIKEMSDKQLYQAIFTPGFSTADKVTTLSGRGVGMDLVKDSLEFIGGNISITTEPGKGTTFTLQLPVNLSMIQGICVRVGKQRYILPKSSIKRIINLHPKDRLSFQGALPCIKTKEGMLELLFLHQFFQGKGPNRRRNSVQYVVEIEKLTTSLGLVVEDVEEIQDVVIKPLPTSIFSLPIYGGCTILGDGTVAMILDPTSLCNQAIGNTPQVESSHG